MEVKLGREVKQGKIEVRKKKKEEERKYLREKCMWQ
jgi:hypothetical protein